jgi:YfiH family protein
MPNDQPILPASLNDHAAWPFTGPGCQVLFVGKGPVTERQEAFRKLVSEPSTLQLSWPRQIHSSVLLEAEREGCCGDGDAIHTDKSGVALSVVTADCLPIVVAGPSHLTTIHAGWRGLAGHLIEKTLDELNEEPGKVCAWIGPAIGPCCYEVGPDVANQVVAASSPEVELSRHPRPYLDLTKAAAVQLTRAGVRNLRTVPVCTRCSPKWLWSYRRDGDRAGRNWTFAWKS